MIPILSAASTVGRLIPNYLSDTLGRFTVLLAALSLSAILTLTLWLPSSSPSSLVAYSALFGFSSGALVSLFPACVAQISPMEQIGVRTGVMFGIVSLACLIGSPIGGQLLEEDPSFRSLQAFSGATMVGGSVLFAGVWWVLGGLEKGKKV
jgi:MFS family permease